MNFDNEEQYLTLYEPTLQNDQTNLYNLFAVAG